MLVQNITHDFLEILDILFNNSIESFDTLSEKLRWIAVILSRKKEFILLKFYDGGSGVNLDIRKQIFDPFFISKEPCKHLGLGLSIAKQILNRYEGNIQLNSEGIQTCFILKLPQEECSNTKSIIN